MIYMRFVLFMLLRLYMATSLKKFYTKLPPPSPSLLPPPPPCNTCIYYSNQKCLYYKILLGKYVYPLYDQIMDQDFATEKTAMDVHTARNDERFCGSKAVNYKEEKI